MESEKCRALLCAIDKGSITAAAETMGYTISGVSRMMAALESEIGFPLLRRSREGVVPTNECLRLLPSLREMVAQAEQCRQMAGELRGVMSGTVAIGTFSSVATHWLPNMICAFQRDYPNIDFEILMGDYPEIEQWILQGRADFGFLHLPTRPELAVTELARDELMVVLPEEHPLARLEKVPVAALAEQPFILLDKAGNRDREVMQVFEQAGTAPRVRFTTLDDCAVMSMVEHGLGVSILPQLVLRRIPYRVALRPLDWPAFRRIGLATRPGEELAPAASRFLAYLPYRDGKALSEKKNNVFYGCALRKTENYCII